MATAFYILCVALVTAHLCEGKETLAVGKKRFLEIPNTYWGTWSSYSACSPSCIGGSKTRTRSCYQQGKEVSTNTCNGAVSMEFQTCTKNDCTPMTTTKCEDAQSSCSSYSKATCNDYATWAIQNCAKYCGFCSDLTPAPTHGLWSHWTGFSTCSVSCGSGYIQRTRHCQGPSPCIGSSYDSQSCYHTCPVPTVPAPVDGHWGPWSAYSHCSHSCGTGIKTSQRFCNNPAPSNGGGPCIGQSYNMMICQIQACAVPTLPAPVDGHWGPWTAYSTCSLSCGTGIQTRHRSCNNPAPSNGGGPCVGHNFTMVTCQLQACVVNGGWGIWTAWSSCSTSCDLGTLSRDRACNNPAPSNGGTQCSGDTTETHECSKGPCPVWSHWFEGDCSVSCGNGTMERLRHCSTGRDSDCPGIAYQMVPCSGVQCV